ncbi:MAG: type II and III secretion system protein family protein [Deltaproteobacteria bacterium]|nr:type II and III secretion system protein family protein [Deltaproteobacteria bacterium]
MNLSKALTLSESYAPAGKVKNLMTVGGTHQVMLEVKIAEMSRSVGRNLGIDLENISHIGDVAVQLLSNFGVSATTTGGPTLGLGYNTWDTMLNALKANGQVKVLAKPNLITLSGQTASFLAGGEYPIPVSDEDGLTIEYKDYGVGLSFTPNVLSPDKINIKVDTSVSERLPTATLTNQNFVAPGLSTRRTATTIELADGQSFVIAGLLSESITESVKKFPFLGDIPILGILFRSSSFQKNETELVIIVTPRLVKPIDKETLPVPTDFYEEPSDTEFYFDMKRSSKKSSKEEPVDGNMDGQFGHSFED